MHGWMESLHLTKYLPSLPSAEGIGSMYPPVKPLTDMICGTVLILSRLVVTGISPAWARTSSPARLSVSLPAGRNEIWKDMMAQSSYPRPQADCISRAQTRFDTIL